MNPVDPLKLPDFLTSIAKIPVSIVWLVVTTCSVLLALPADKLKVLRLDSFVESWGSWIGFSLLLASCLLLIKGVIWAAAAWKRGNERVAADAMAIDSILSLDDREKAVLREFTIQGQNTIAAPFNDPVVAGLIAKKVLMLKGTMSRGFLFPVAISPAVLNFLLAQHIGLSDSDDADEVRRIKQARPEFVKHHRY